MISLLPEGAQIIVEIDLARLRNNAVIGDVITAALGDVATVQVPGLAVPAASGCRALPAECRPGSRSPATAGCKALPAECGLGASDLLVFAAYGVGTSAAATVAVLAIGREIQGGVRVAPDLVALGPDPWTAQIATRAAIASAQPLSIPGPLRELRERSFPNGATGAAVRITAVLPFDARVAFARLIGFEAPAQVSLWADVADDAALVLEVDATDPGTRRGSDSGRRFSAVLRKALAAIAQARPVRALGVASSLDGARLEVAGPWLRAVITIGPRHLARVVERARAMLPPRHETD